LKKKENIISFFIFSILIVGTCFTSIAVKGTNENDFDWVYMFYLDGDNKLSAFLQQTLNTIRSVGSTEDVQLVALYDGNDIGDTKLYYIVENNLVEQDWPEESDMDDSDTLTQFAQKVMGDFSAANYALNIHSNMGSGWQGVCTDSNGDGLMITMPELHDAFKTITNDGANKLAIVLIESCLCGNLELRYQIRNYCNYMIGYADCGIVGDIPYENILSEIVDNPLMSPEELARYVVDVFVPQNYPDIKQSFGLLDSTKLDALANTINELGLYFIKNIDECRNEILTALDSVRKYGITWDIDYFVDLGHFLDLLDIDDSEFLTLKNNVRNEINKAVIAKAILPGDHSEGFNIYIPQRTADYNDALRYDHDLPSPYEENLFAIDTYWDEFLKMLLGLLDNLLPNTPSVSGPSKGKAGEQYDYIVCSTDPDGDQISYYFDWGDQTSTLEGPCSSGQEVTVSHTFKKEGNFDIKVKAIDEHNGESDWSIHSVTMPKAKYVANLLSFSILLGKITDIEKNQDGGFRFLPVNMFELSFSQEYGIDIYFREETNGGFPCCGYIDPESFRGLLLQNYIVGIWLKDC
jgi:hypothetical protein